MKTPIEMVELTESSVVVASDHQTSTEVDGESVILDLEGGVYYGLNAVGAQIWKMIQEPISVDEVVEAITADYDVDREQCLEDVVELFRELEENNLVVVQES